MYSKKYRNNSEVTYYFQKYKKLYSNFPYINGFKVVKPIEFKNNFIIFQKINYKNNFYDLFKESETKDRINLCKKSGKNIGLIHKTLNNSKILNDKILIHGDYHPGNILIDYEGTFINIDLESPKSYECLFYKENSLYLDLATFIIWIYHIYNPIYRIDKIYKSSNLEFLIAFIKSYEKEANIKIDFKLLIKFLKIESKRNLENIKISSKILYNFWKLYNIYLIIKIKWKLKSLSRNINE